MNSQPLILISAVIIVAAIAIFIVCRELVCWHFKINQTVFLLEQILDVATKGVEAERESIAVLKRVNQFMLSAAETEEPLPALRPNPAPATVKQQQS